MSSIPSSSSTVRRPIAMIGARSPRRTLSTGPLSMRRPSRDGGPGGRAYRAALRAHSSAGPLGLRLRRLAADDQIDGAARHVELRLGLAAVGGARHDAVAPGLDPVEAEAPVAARRGPQPGARDGDPGVADRLPVGVGDGARDAVE